ncbi:MAG: DPP IV N-terminal domain-containing protein [Chitinophagaceae bacterium]|nr:DPP IV N-terminal domain-containing protein [Chitinophagaceae bacterium]
MRNVIKSMLVIGISVSSSFSLTAQEKQLTMDDAMLGARTSLAPQNLKQLQFVEGTNRYVYLKKSDNGEIWMQGEYKKPETAFLDLTSFNAQVRMAGLDTFKNWPSIRFQKDSWTISSTGAKFRVYPASHRLETLISKEIGKMGNVERSASGYIAYLDNHNLFVSGKVGTNQVTTDGSDNIVYASSVHRDEFGISKGTFWSPSGNLLAFYRMDQSMVADYPIIDWSVSPAVNHNIKYPMAGGVSHQVTIGVYNPQNKSLIYLNTGLPADQYLTNIVWSPNDQYVFVAVLNREQNHMWLNQYDASTGAFLKTIFEETNDKYVEPLHPILFLPNNPNQFIWQSTRDGWNHLYLYDMNGKMLKQLTKGNWEVLDVKQFSRKGDELYLISTRISPIGKSIDVLNLKNGKLSGITNDAYVHSAIISDDGNVVLDTYSGVDNPRTVRLINLSKNKSENIFVAPDPLAGYQKADINIFTLPNIKGEELFCKTFKPVNFDSTKKYPVIVYWYGGPHLQLVTNSWNAGSGDYWFHYMAERGYLVLSFDTRGSDNRGRDFEQEIFRNVGNKQMEDMMSVVSYLSRLGYADTSRMGLFGWSFGGFMTTNFMLNHPGIFKAAVAGGPVTNWAWYEVMYGERYMDTPKENPEGYAHNNLVSQAGKLKGKLLMIHGLQDPVVLQQHSVDFVKSAVDHKVQVDYMIYPGHEHNVLGKDRAHLYQKVTDYFMQNLNICK